MNYPLNEKLSDALIAEGNPLRLALIEAIESAGIDALDFWQDWACDGNNYDVHFHHDEEKNSPCAIAYATWSDGEYLQTDTNIIVAEIVLDTAEWCAMGNQPMRSHNVELRIALHIAVNLAAHSAEQAIEAAYRRFHKGDLDIMHALEHCTAKAVITDDLPRNGDKCFTVNVLESLNRDFKVYADSASEAENLVRSHLHTHIALTDDDTIGYDVIAEED